MKYEPAVLTTINGKDAMTTPMGIEFIHRTIWLTGMINEELAAEINMALHQLARSAKDEITIYINSLGGEVAAGLSIYDTAMSLDCDICTVATGRAVSMAAVLLSAMGTKGKRYAQKNAEIMIHEASAAQLQGKTRDVQIQFDLMKKMEQKMVAMLAESTGKSVEVIEQDICRDYFMNAEEARSYGLIDHIGDPFGE